jgi:hypothetical protein
VQYPTPLAAISHDLQVESLSFNLGVPVLRHSRKKPACGEEILRYFQQLHVHRASAPSHPSESDLDAPRPPDPPSLNEPLDPDRLTPVIPPSSPVITPTSASPRLLIIGDRLLTDVLLATTLPSTHLGIWTTHLWSRPDLPLLRFLEQSLLRTVLWTRNQTFRDGVLEKRARGETWLGREGWVWRIRRMVLGAVRRVPVAPEPVPPRTNELARFIVPLPTKALTPPLPTTRTGWAWYYSKIGARYAGKGAWVGLLWTGVRVARAGRTGWRWAISRIKEARAKRAETRTPVETKP